MLFSSLVSLALVASAASPVTHGFSDKKAHELSRSRARSHYAKINRSSNQNNNNNATDSAVVERDVAVNVDVSLEKRATYSGRATYYAVGLGACGWHNNPSDFIVAQNSAQYGGGYPGPNCGRSITISYGGKQVSATIADECPTCDYGGLDLSEGLFTQFADTGAGVFYMSWWYNDESQQEATTTSSTPTPTSTYTPPTSTYVEPSTTPTPTSTYVEPSTSAAASSAALSSAVAASSSLVEASTTLSASLASSSTNATASLADPDYFQTNGTVSAVNATSTASADESEETVGVDASFGNLVMFNQAVANLGHIVVVGAQK
ncbi:hypothetical protein I316_01787 [Kwoniella heveanensis BCC8398]|uniref:B2-aldehyde-forming enzyme n=1 Tax=Kwoniella heveanensis BCC8398 TaxID=1296120 RepID=A0A1B9GZV9_9TREE|nr:hypothetical protein I316_01787 [Kwoniella heveanensis BCC8398]